MNTPDDDQVREFLEEQLEAEAEREVERMTLAQGQIVALVSLLQGKGLITSEERAQWEADSERAQELLTTIVQAKNDIDNAADDLVKLRSLEKFLEHSIMFVDLFERDPTKSAAMTDRLTEIQGAIAIVLKEREDAPR